MPSPVTTQMLKVPPERSERAQRPPREKSSNAQEFDLELKRAKPPRVSDADVSPATTGARKKPKASVKKEKTPAPEQGEPQARPAKNQIAGADESQTKTDEQEPVVETSGECAQDAEPAPVSKDDAADAQIDLNFAVSQTATTTVTTESAEDHTATPTRTGEIGITTPQKAAALCLEQTKRAAGANQPLETAPTSSENADPANAHALEALTPDAIMSAVSTPSANSEESEAGSRERPKAARNDVSSVVDSTITAVTAIENSASQDSHALEEGHSSPRGGEKTVEAMGIDPQLRTSTVQRADARPGNVAPPQQASPAPEQQFATENHPQILSAIRGELLPGGGMMHIKLDPPELGALQINIHMQDGVMTASFQTSSDDATRLLSHSLSQLKHVLESQGVSVEKLQVQQAPRDQQQSFDDAQRQQQRYEESSAQQEQQRREMLRRMWRKLTGESDPLDMVA